MTNRGDAADRDGQAGSESRLPVRVDRRKAAELVTDRYFPISPRTVEAWPLRWRHVNGKALCDVDELFALAQAKLDAAPPVRGGRKAAA